MIEQMEAGRELDVLVARAMGLNVVALDWPCGREPECGVYEAAHFIPVGCDTWFTEEGPVYLSAGANWPPEPGRMHPERQYAYVEPVPFYSTDWAAAGAALEWLSIHGYQWWLEYDLQSGGVGYWFRTTLPWVYMRQAWAMASPQVAIARAVAMIGEARKGER